MFVTRACRIGLRSARSDHQSPVVGGQCSASVCRHVCGSTSVFRYDVGDDCKKRIKSKLVGFPLKLRRSTEFGGRGLFARRAVSKGEIIPQEKPLIDLHDPAWADQVGRFEAAVGNIQLYDDDGLQGRISTTDIIVGCMLQMVRSSPEWPCQISDLPVYQCLGYNLSSDGVPESTCTKPEMDRLFDFLKGVLDLRNASTWTAEEFAILRCKITTNSIGGSQLYLAASMINHQCGDASNAAWHPRDPIQTLIAVKPIAEGEQVFMSYTGAIDYEERKQHLRLGFGFDCKCAFCFQQAPAFSKHLHMVLG